MIHSKLSCGIIMRVADVQIASKWFCDNLFFRPVQKCAVQNADCVVYFEKSEPSAIPALSKTEYTTGLAHIALATQDIEAALTHCDMQGLVLQTNEGKSFFNPGVFGEGEYYFNIVTPFSAVIEIAQRVTQPLCKGTEIIGGLDHIGVPCVAFDDEVQALQTQDFNPLFETVYNVNEADGRIVCSMLSDQNLTLEIYQFLDKTSCAMPSQNAFSGVYYPLNFTTPSGLQFISRLPCQEKEHPYETL